MCNAYRKNHFPDFRKPIVFSQTSFAIQARMQEMTELESSACATNEKRLSPRMLVTNKKNTSYQPNKRVANFSPLFSITQENKLLFFFFLFSFAKPRHRLSLTPCASRLLNSLPCLFPYLPLNETSIRHSQHINYTA